VKPSPEFLQNDFDRLALPLRAQIVTKSNFSKFPNRQVPHHLGVKRLGRRRINDRNRIAFLKRSELPCVVLSTTSVASCIICLGNGVRIPPR
jgi:hypothetical protein